ncbi:MAG: hypothetical protein V3U60_16620 [Gammaproteobacteria bacterium]
MTRTFRFVPHHMVEEYHEQGWVFHRVLMGHHGLHCCLMEQVAA